jgi:dephospho-CoA kinase
MNKMYAIVGMCGSGKSVVCDYLENSEYTKIYFGGVTMKELKKVGLQVNPENEKNMREKLRSEYGMGAFAKILLPEIEEAYKKGNVVLDGLYSWDEYVILKDKFESNLEMIAVVCDKNIRYERLSKRSIRPLTLEEAKKRDIAEIENIKKGGPIAFADFYLYNNGEKEKLESQIEELLRRN